MHELVLLKDILIILTFAIVVVVLFHRLKLPAIAGFILSGLLVGPEGLGLIDDAHQVEVLAEIGVALLLFGIGAELALSKLRRLWKLAVVGGFLQVGLTSLAGYVIGRAFELPVNTAVFVGLVIALSSTAIVLRGLQQRGEVDAPHGRLILGVLVFQDFSVIPIMLIIPLLVGAGAGAGDFALTLAKSVGIIVVVLLLAVFVVPRVLKLVARTRQRQLFILAVFVICLGTAWLVTKSGASLAIGAFLAGLVVSGSEYRYQALADMISFREVFASLFFVSVGMLLSPATIVENLIPILGILGAILVGKSMIVFLTAAVMRLPLLAASRSALSLAQVGEFSFILLYAVEGTGLVDPVLGNSLVSAAILSMFVTPFAMSLGPRLAAGLGRVTNLERLLAVETAEHVPEKVEKLTDHVIIAGYGFAGKELARVLEQNQVPYFVVDLNIENVRRASEDTGKACFGDITSDGVLTSLGLERARELVLLINDPTASEHAVRVARGISSELYITVRTTYLLDVDSLLAAGASEVVASEREAAAQVASQLLKRFETDPERVSDEVATIRDNTEDSLS